MYFEEDHCAHCNNEISSEARTLPFNQHFGGGSLFCREDCFNAEFKKYMLEVPSKEQLRKDEQDDRELFKSYKEDINGEFKSGIYRLLQKRYNDAITAIRAERNWYYPRSRENAFNKAIHELWFAHIDGQRAWQTAKYAKEAEASEKERQRQARELEHYLEKADRKREQEARERERIQEKEQKQREWDEAHPPTVTVSAMEISEEIKFEHTLCVAASGGGKTTLMFHEIVNNLKRPDPPGMVIIDPKGTVLKKLRHLDYFRPEGGHRLIIVDPTDMEGPPAFNLFKQSNERRAARYTESAKRALENKVVDLLSYVFSSRNQKLTGKQSPCFSNVCRLLMRLPNPSLSLMFDVLNDQQSDKKASFQNTRSEWKEVINKLPDLSARFFREQYYSNYASTRDEIASRLYGVVENPDIQSVFNADHNRLDLFDALQTGATVIVNVPFALLGKPGVELFGRYMIALTLAAAFERITIPDKSQWRPAFLYIDEAQEFADEEQTPLLLRLAREYKLGVFVSLQSLGDLPGDQLKAAVLTNSRIRYASSLTTDANIMAKAMDCVDNDPDFFKQTYPTKTHVRLGCFVKEITKHPVIIELAKGAIDAEPKMPTSSYERLMQRNRDLFSSALPEPAAQKVSLSPSKAPEPVKQVTPKPAPRQPPLDTSSHEDTGIVFSVAEPAADGGRNGLKLRMGSVNHFSAIPEVTEIKIKPGQTIEQFDELIGFEVNGYIHSVPSVFAGVIVEIKVRLGDKLTDQTVLVVIKPDYQKTELLPTAPPQPSVRGKPDLRVVPKTPPGPKPELELDEHE